MLSYLHVRNFALIRDAEIDFGSGLNILSGETGAGKSILMDSIALALGARQDAQMVRTGADHALIELVFKITEEKIKEALASLGIAVEEDGSLILSRRISEGKSLSKVNGETVPARLLKDAARLLISVYGQNDQRLLLDEEQHLSMLDAFGKDKVQEALLSYRAAYQDYREKKNALSSIGGGSDEERQREMDFLLYEIEEIEEAKLKAGEEKELLKEHQRLMHAEERTEALQRASAALSGEAGDAVSEASRMIREAERFDESFKGLSEQLLNLEQLMQDLLQDLNERLLREEPDSGRLSETESRLAVIDKLKRKYGGSEEAVLESLSAFRKRSEVLQHFEEEKESLEAELKKAGERLREEGKKLHLVRLDAAERFSKAMEEALPELNFLSVVFRTEVTETKRYTSQGADEVRFLISLNPGEEVRPLAKTASGGELSRIMLAIKTLSTNAEDTGTLIFDEVDAGISGRTAMAVAKKLKLIAGNHQVLLISHLPQIVAAADRHFLIEKSASDDSTETRVTELSGEDSVRELARLLAAGEVTDISIENAREMKKQLKSL